MTHLALAQLRPVPLDADENRARTVACGREAFGQGADILVLPEMVVPGYVTDRAGLSRVAEPLAGPTLEAWSALARESGGYIVGGFCESDGELLYNSALAVGPEGVLLHYRKLHLFDREKRVFAPGNLGLPVADTRHGRIGLCVCYDLRFVEVMRVLALRGADLVCVPTAWVTGFDQLRWDAEGMAPQAAGAVLQANLNQVFVACASQVGHNDEYAFLGSSVLADPSGSRVAGPLSGTQEALIVAEMDPDAIRRARHRGGEIWPRKDRRTDVYGVWNEGKVW